MFDDLCKTIEELLIAEGAQSIETDEDLIRGIEGTDHILQAFEINCCLAPYRCIYHTQESRRDQGKMTTAHID